MEGLIGKKIGMTSIHTEDGRNIACTVVEAGPCVVTQVKTEDSDKYNALQLGFDEAKVEGRNATTKPMKGHFAKAKTTPKREVVEFRRENRILKEERDVLKNVLGRSPPVRGRNSLCYPASEGQLPMVCWWF